MTSEKWLAQRVLQKKSLIYAVLIEGKTVWARHNLAIVIGDDNHYWKVAEESKAL